jgi:putative transposase
VFFDALRVKIRDEGLVRNKAVHIALGVRADGTKEILGLWLEQNEGAKFWLRVMNELRNRGVEDVLLAVVDGLKGFPEAILAVFPEATIQTCVRHRSRTQGDQWLTPPAAAQPRLRLLQGPQDGRGRAEGHLPGGRRRRRRGRADGVRGRRLGPALPGDRPELATGMARGHPVFCLPRRRPPPLHDECH